MKLYPLDRIFDKTGNKYLSTCIILKRARMKSEKNLLLANELNKQPDNRNVIEDTIKEFLADDLKYEL
jgi:DNA-directed RNA polymerase subunit K/omega